MGLLQAPPTDPAALRDEVERRATGLRRRRNVHRLEATAVAAVLAVVAVLLSATGGHAPTSRNVRTIDPVDERSVEPAPAPVHAVPRAGGDATETRTTGAPPRPIGTRHEVPVTGSPSVAPAVSGRTRVLIGRDDKLFEVDPDGGNSTLVRSAAPDYVAWSPDGRTLAFSEGTDIKLLDPASGAESTLFDGSNRGVPLGLANSLSSAPSWTPDGRSILFVRATPPPSSYSVWTIDVATRLATEVVLPMASPDVPAYPKVSKDGRVLYLCEAEGASLCVSDLQGRDLGLIQNTEFLGGFNWSPDGQWVSITPGYEGSKQGLAVVRPDGTGWRWVVAEHASGTPHWMPDGSGLFFQLNDDSAEFSSLHFIGIDGLGLRPIGESGDAPMGVRVT